MVDIKTKEGKTVIDMIEGDVAELAADALIVLNAMYETIYEESPEMAESFARAVRKRINSKNDTPFRIIGES